MDGATAPLAPLFLHLWYMQLSIAVLALLSEDHSPSQNVGKGWLCIHDQSHFVLGGKEASFGTNPLTLFPSLPVSVWLHAFMALKATTHPVAEVTTRKGRCIYSTKSYNHSEWNRSIHPYTWYP